MKLRNKLAAILSAFVLSASVWAVSADDVKTQVTSSFYAKSGDTVTVVQEVDGQEKTFLYTVTLDADGFPSFTPVQDVEEDTSGMESGGGISGVDGSGDTVVTTDSDTVSAVGSTDSSSDDTGAGTEAVQEPGVMSNAWNAVQSFVSDLGSKLESYNAELSNKVKSIGADDPVAPDTVEPSTDAPEVPVDPVTETITEPEAVEPTPVVEPESVPAAADEVVVLPTVIITPEDSADEQVDTDPKTSGCLR